MLTILVIAVIVGAVIHGKQLPKSKLYTIWLIFGVYMYFSMWIGTALGNGPPPLWLTDANFTTWKDYMLMPLIFVAAGMVIEDRKAVRTVILITAISLVFIDRSSLLDSMSRSWATFDENKRDSGPLGITGSNGLAAFLAQFGMFFWGVSEFLKRRKAKLLLYGLVSITLFATMYTFSRASYIAVLFSVFVLGLLKDRKLLLVVGAFLLTWQTIVPTAVRQRVDMTHNSSGQLEASAQERIDLWENAKTTIANNPIFGTGFATFQFGEHVDRLKDTHNWYVKVMLETGIIGAIIALILLQQLLVVTYRLFRAAEDPLYRGLGLGLFLTLCSSIVANCFGDRWTYIEINGLTWVLVGAAVRASHLIESEPAKDLAAADASIPAHLYTAYQ
ncbi:MAG: O-antigen ligase family protein [Acidobacteriaceae bacterium]